MRKISILSLIGMFLLAMSVSAKDIYVNQATGSNTTGTGTEAAPYKDLSYVLYRTSITGGDEPAKTHLAGKTFGAKVGDGDNVYIMGTYDLTQDPAYVPVSQGANNSGFWTHGEFVVDGNHTYNIVGMSDNSSVITCAGAATDPNAYGGEGNAFRLKSSLVFKNLRFEHMGIAIDNTTSDGDRGIIWAEHISKDFGFENCTFTKNASKSSWLLNLNNVLLTMTDCTIEDNYAKKGLILASGGGGFMNDKRPNSISGCNILNNGKAPGIENNSNIKHGDDYATIVLQQCYDTKVLNTTIKDNISYAQGNAILIKEASASLLIDGCVIDGNQSRNNDNAPAIFIKNAKPTVGITISNTEITNNTSIGNGGAISLRDANNGTFLFENCLIKGNDVSTGSWKLGGGLLFQKGQGDYTFKNCRFEGNKASKGGAVAFDSNVGDTWSANMKFENCSFVGNVTSQSGGAFFYTNNNAAFTPNVTFVNSTFYDNRVNDGGSGNEVGGSVGYFDNAVNPNATFKMVNCTLVGNTTGSGERGGIRVRNNAVIMPKLIHNCFMEGNAKYDITCESAGTNGIDLQSSYVDECQNYDPAAAGNNTVSSTGNLPADVAYYVSKTGAVPLLATSTALTAGNLTLLSPITTDQLGVTRGSSAIAVGAVEKPAVIITSANNASVKQGGTFTATAEGVLDAFIAGDVTITSITYTLSGTVPAGINISPAGEISVASSVATGSYTFNVIATDAAETAYTQAFDLTVTVNTGLDKIVGDKAIRSIGYYDLTGKSVSAETKGFVVKKIVYEDGSISNSKAMVE